MSERVRGSATLSSAFVVVALGVLSASAQLNPTVKVLPKPQTQVPPECEQGLAPAVPRVIVAEAAPEETKPARAVPPPSLDLKTQLRAVQLAAERGDRDAFKAALADARAAVNAYPRGGERNAANDVVSVYSDLERLWDYQFTSPTGAFFDSSTDFVAMMRRFPSYSAAIADQTLTVSGQTLYPTPETRQFLVTEAARRLNSLGVRTPTRIVETPPAPVPAPQPRVVPQPVPRRVPEKPAIRKAERTTPHPAPHKAARKAPKTATKKPTTATKKTTKTTKPPVKVAEARKPSAKPRAAEPQPQQARQPARQPAPQPVPQPTPAPVPQPKAAPPPMPVTTPKPSPAPVPTPQPQPQPVTPPNVSETAASTATTASTPAMPTDTMSTTTTATTQTETTATTGTTTTAPKENQPPTGGRMNLLFAIILIIVGVGVLIILFRASD